MMKCNQSLQSFVNLPYCAQKGMSRGSWRKDCVTHRLLLVLNWQYNPTLSFIQKSQWSWFEIGG